MDAGAGVGVLSDPPPRGRRASGGSYEIFFVARRGY